MKSAADVLDHLAKDSSEDGVTRVCTEIVDWAKDGHVTELTALAHQLEATGKPAYETVVDLVEDQLALTQSDAAIDAALALADEKREKTLTKPRSELQRQCAFASRLGYAQTKEAFVSALGRANGKHRDLFACWMHELVLRRSNLTSEPAAQKLAADLAATSHPLAGLPLGLLPIEREAPSYMPLYGDRGLTGVLEALASGPMSARTMPPPAEGKAVTATEVPAPGSLAAAVAPWRGKLYRVETRAFDLGTEIEPSLLGSWLLRALPLESTKDVKREGLETKRLSADAVFGALFAAAANGGAASQGLGGALGRKEAWKSIGALAGAPENAGVEEIAVIAKKTAFLQFGASGPWFHDIAWDLGILALGTSGRHVVVLAATDAE
jgi:hypothetical protein